jgi:hypothetical protein
MLYCCKKFFEIQKEMISFVCTFLFLIFLYPFLISPHFLSHAFYLPIL